MANTSQDKAAEENRKRLLEEAQKNSAASVKNTAQDAVQLKSLPQVSPEERTRVMDEQAAKISTLRDSLPNPMQMGPSGNLTPVQQPSDANFALGKAERYLQDLKLPLVPVGDGAIANQATADNINFSIQSQQNEQKQAENTRTTALAKIAETAPARQAAAKAANMTDEAGQQASMDRHNKFAGTNDTLPKSSLPANASMKDKMAEFEAGSPERSRVFQAGLREREQDDKDSALEYRIANKQRSMATRNLQNLNRRLQNGKFVDPNELQKAHAYLALSERRLGGSNDVDEMRKYAKDNMQLYRKDRDAYNQKFGYASPAASAPASAPAPAPMIVTKKDDSYAIRSTRESLLNKGIV